MNLSRDIVKHGELQIKTTKRSGTLLRKKEKHVYEREALVALCVHDGKIPLLEWYPNRPAMHTHQPDKVVDLLDCLYVNPIIGNSSDFIVGFSEERPPLEFGACNAAECKAWVEAIGHTLKRLSCLNSTENEYCPVPHQQHEIGEASTAEYSSDRVDPPQPSVSSPTPPPRLHLKKTAQYKRDRLLSLSDQIPLQNIPITGRVTRQSSASRESPLSPKAIDALCRTFSEDDSKSPRSPSAFPLRTEKILTANDDTPPALPPRKSASLSSAVNSPRNSDSMIAAKVLKYNYDVPLSDVKNESDYNQLPLRNAYPSRNDVYTAMTFKDDEGIANSLQEMCKLRLQTTSGSSSGSRTSSLSDSHRSSNNDEYHPLSPPPRPPKGLSVSNNQYDVLISPPPIQPQFDAFKDALNKPRTVSLLLTTCVEHIAFCEVLGKVWIAGWSPTSELCLKGVIHFGDQVVQIGDQLVEKIGDVQKAIYECAIPGKPLEIKVRQIPHGEVFSIVKPQNPKKSIGIIMHKRKNRVESVEDKSPARASGLQSRLAPYVYGPTDVPAVITEVNDVPLNPFARNDSFFHRLEQIPPGGPCNIIVHPYDLVKLIKQQLKTNIKNYKKFFYDS
jgi:hypothetical protein